MGFGLLFIGYFISTVVAFAFPAIAGFTGYALIVLALLSLAEYDKKFVYTLIPAAAAALINLFSVTGELLDGFMSSSGASAFFESAESFTSPTESAVKLVFHVMLCFAVRGIAADTGATKIVFPATRNAFLYAVSYALTLVSTLFADGAKYLVPTAMIVYLVTVALNHVMIFSAYMNICDESDVDMEIKKTNIKWYDALVAKTAEREQKAADETKAYFEAKYARKMKNKNAGNESAHSKKKKKK